MLLQASSIQGNTLASFLCLVFPDVEPLSPVHVTVVNGSSTNQTISKAELDEE